MIAEDFAKMRVIADIDEADVGHIAVGQTARFTVDAFSGQSFAARLTELHTAPKVVQDVVTYEAVLVLDKFMTRVRSSMEFVAAPSCGLCSEDLFRVVDGVVTCVMCDRPAQIASAR